MRSDQETPAARASVRGDTSRYAGRVRPEDVYARPALASGDLDSEVLEGLGVSAAVLERDPERQEALRLFLDPGRLERLLARSVRPAVARPRGTGEGCWATREDDDH